MKTLKKLFPALQEKNICLLVAGQFVSFAGTWLQMIVLSWLVYEMTGSSIWTAIVASLQTLPGIFLSPIGGIFVDRFKKKDVLYFTNGVGAVLAFLLGLLTFTGALKLWEILIVSALGGLIMAIDSPARSSIVPELIREKNPESRKQLIRSATGLNTGLVTGSQIIGPGMAGICLWGIGYGGCFILNAVSFVAGIISLWMMVIEERPQNLNHPFHIAKEAVKYILANRQIIILMVLSGVVASSFSYRAVLPSVCHDIFHGGPKELSGLAAFSGLGACLGGMAIAGLVGRLPLAYSIALGNFLAGFSMLLFLVVPEKGVILGMIFLAFAGMGFSISFSPIKAAIQNSGSGGKNLLGTIMGISTAAFFGGLSLGNLLIGFLTDNLSVRVALGLFGVFFLFLTVFTVFSKDRLIHDS
ncbi:MAG: MFS transporter [bacterium]